MTNFTEENNESSLIKPGIKESTLPVRLVVAPKDETCSLTSAYRIFKELGGQVNLTKVDSEATHSYFLRAMIKPELLVVLRDELTDTEFSSAFALSATTAIVAAITAMSF